jgi:hypothetical protein
LGPIRYLLFGAIAVVVAAVLFFLLNLAYVTGRDASTNVIESWIVDATCKPYELTGSVKNSSGAPVAFAVVEARYLDARLVTRSGPDGVFKVTANEAICGRRPNEVAVTVLADRHRVRREVLSPTQATLDVVLTPVDF